MRALRLVADLSAAGRRPGAVPRRQLLLLSGGPFHLGPLQDQHGVQHRLPRLRRAAGHGRRRARDRGHRPPLGKDPLEIRKRNFYGKQERNVTPYHQEVEDNVIDELIEALEASRLPGAPRGGRAASTRGAVLKRGIALTPVKFGISFTATH